MKTIELIHDGRGYWQNDSKRIHFCADGLATFFKCHADELEDTIWLNISDKKFKGSYKIKLKNMEVKLGRKEWYITIDTRHELAKLLDTDPYNQTFYVSFEVEA